MGTPIFVSFSCLLACLIVVVWTEFRMAQLSELKVYSCAEVAKHNKVDDCWVIYHDKVLDLTPWLPKHPGGTKAIMSVAGLDATDEIVGMHNDTVTKKWVYNYVIGRVNDLVIPPHVQEYRELIDRVTHDPKWMTTDYWYYIKRIPFFIALLAGSISIYLLSSHIVAHMFAGVLLGKKGKASKSNNNETTKYHTRFLYK
eukprot:c10555_g1_i1.p1 GENE.c10555_g1_i1~~c10555_g1_i1.p1  ORF type:complete len:199 (+),score=34.45 c10555_g1_i1:1-597(+)